MNPEKVVFGFFIILALTLNFGFFVGEIENPDHHHVYELFAVVVVNLIATVLKFGDRSQMGALLLATSLVAILQLIAAALVWTFAVHVNETGLTPDCDGEYRLAHRWRHAGQCGLCDSAHHRNRDAASIGRSAGSGTMQNIVFLILRRMRQPLLTLLVVYAVSVFGLTVIPGQDADGNVWHMSIFHAFYFVSYMATTIGFGEIPYEFTDGQRLWVSLSLYASVISWIYAFGTILALVQDRAFQEAIAEYRFARHIRKMREPFHLVCGYGETGTALVQALTSRGQHAVVIDIDEARTSIIQLQDLREFVPALHGDAAVTRHLEEAGLQHPSCAGVVALTDNNEVNLKIAITAKLLNPDVKVISRADSHDVEDNMASFGTDHIVDPFDTFAAYLAVAFQAPCLYLLQRWLTGREGTALSEPVYPPRDGHWIVCGYGRFGKAICRRLQGEGIKVIVVESRPDLTGRPETGFVAGRGTEADTLTEAGIEDAAGLVAGTDDDANNLSIVMTARELNSDLFVVVRQNQHGNHNIIAAVDADMVMHPERDHR